MQDQQEFTFHVNKQLKNSDDLNMSIQNSYLKIDSISRKERNNSIHPGTIAAKWGNQLDNTATF